SSSSTRTRAPAPSASRSPPSSRKKPSSTSTRRCASWPRSPPPGRTRRRWRRNSFRAKRTSSGPRVCSSRGRLSALQINTAAGGPGMLLLRRPIFVASAFLTLSVATAIGAATISIVCTPNTAYSVTSSAPPPTANWTTTSGALWTPPGGFPGCSTGDTASDTNASPTTIVVNSVIPNPIAGLNLACNGCVIDIQSGGQLTLAGNGTIASGATLRFSGGSFVVATGGNLTFDSGSSLDVTSGTVSIQSGGQINVNDGTATGSGTVDNAGSVQMNGTAFTFNTTFNVLAGGTVYANSGTLSLAGGGNGDGPFNVSGTLEFPSGTYTTTPNGTVSGGGTLSITGGTLSIGGVTSPDNFNMSARTLPGASLLSLGRTISSSG